MLLETLGVLRDISILFMCLLPALIVGGIGIYTFFVLRPWEKVDQANQKYVITNLQKGVELTQKASTTTESVGRKAVSPIIKLYSFFAAARAFLSTLLTGRKPVRKPVEKPSITTVAIRDERRRQMAEREASKQKAKEEHTPRLAPAPAAAEMRPTTVQLGGTPPPSPGRIDPYGQQPSAPSVPRSAPGDVDETVENMIDTAGANPMLTPDQPGKTDEVFDERQETSGRVRVMPGVEFNDVSGTVTSADLRTDMPPRPLGDEAVEREKRERS